MKVETHTESIREDHPDGSSTYKPGRHTYWRAEMPCLDKTLVVTGTVGDTTGAVTLGNGTDIYGSIITADWTALVELVAKMHAIKRG